MQRASSLLRFFASGAMYYRVVFALLLIASCIAGAFASNECNVKAIARADLNLERYMGRWFEIRYNSTDHPEEDSWQDYSENYTLGSPDPNRVKLYYSFTNSTSLECDYINSKRLFYYLGKGQFTLTKYGTNYTYIVVFIDDAYSYAVVTICQVILPSGQCDTIPDVKVFSRTNDYFDDATENTIQDFFKANLTCVDYNSLRESKHSQRICPLPGTGNGAVSTVFSSVKFSSVIALLSLTFAFSWF